MEFGSFMEFPPVASGSDSAAFDQALAEVEEAERVGLDAVWLAELHGAPERSVLSSPMMMAAAIASRTKTLKIGIAVQVLPLSHPLRLAEEAATIDQISHGRLIYGIGRSGVVRTYEDYGLAYSESRERFAETLDILKQAWTEPRFSHTGKYYSFDNVAVTPKPYQKPWPELRMAAATPETFPQIGKLGHLRIFAAGELLVAREVGARFLQIIPIGEERFQARMFAKKIAGAARIGVEISRRDLGFEFAKAIGAAAEKWGEVHLGKS